MKKRTLLLLIAAVAFCIMIGTTAFASECSPFLEFGIAPILGIDDVLCGESPVATANTMPATAPYYPGLEPPCKMIADMTLIWIHTTSETIDALLPPEVMYVPPVVNVRIPEPYCSMFYGAYGAAIDPIFGECTFRPFGDEKAIALALLDYQETSCYGPYREVIFLIPGVTVDPDVNIFPDDPQNPNDWQYHYDLGPAHIGLYLPYLWLSSDGPIAAGREIWGFPKKMADISFKDTAKKRTWTVKRSLSADGTAGGDHLPILHYETQREPIIKAWIEPDTTFPHHPDEVKFPPLLNMKIIPGVENGIADVRELNLVPLDTQTSGETGYGEDIFFGTAGVELIGGPDDPINDIDVLGVFGGYQFRYNFYLSAGRTLTDYLHE